MSDSRDPVAAWQEGPVRSGSKTLIHSTAVSIENIRVASPCTASWGQMEGDERVRFCQSCQKSVYNLSAMSRIEAEQLVAEKEGRLCVRYYQRADGKVLTGDCPVGLRGVRRRIALRLSMAIALTFSLWSFILGRGWTPTHEMGGVGRLNPAWQQERSNILRQDQPWLASNELDRIEAAPMMGAPLPQIEVAPPPHQMGRIAIAPATGKFPSNRLGNPNPAFTEKTPLTAHEKAVKKLKAEPKPSHLHQITTNFEH